MPVSLSPAAFDEAVAQALEDLPEELFALLDNVVVMVADEAPADDPDLLGLYEGIPVTERDSGYLGMLPDRVLLFRENLCEMCDDLEDLVSEIEVTVVHELAHHLGIDDDRLDELGYA